MKTLSRRACSGSTLVPDMIHPYDYGHIPGTAAPDGHEVDAFVGRAQLGLVGLIALVHEPSGIANPKLLVNLTPDDADVIVRRSMTNVTAKSGRSPLPRFP